MTLSPITGRRPNYAIFCADIGVSDVTYNSRLFAVTSTTYSTQLLLCLLIDIQQSLVQHTQSVSVPIRHPSDKSSAWSQASRQTDIYMYNANTTCQLRTTRYTHDMRVASVCGLFSWSMAAGFVSFSSRQFALTQYIKHGLFFFRFTVFFLPEQAQRGAYAARGAQRLVY